MDKHILYIKRCLDIAKLARGYVAPNPIVGAVIVHKNKIIGEGYHQYVGGAHAEIEALNKVEDKSILREATIYVSLEPCFHFGRTPPCVDSLLSYAFKEVIICFTDPDTRVNGKSIEKLKTNGVAVKVGYLKNQGLRQNAYFICRSTQKRPYIILKYAQYANHLFGAKDQQVWISNPYTKRLVHRWRREIGAILVGTTTAIIDNPRLNNRLYFGPSPLRILLDRNLKVPSTVNLLSDGLPTLIFTEKRPPSNAHNACEYICLSFSDQLIPNLLKELYERDIDSLMVEGGVATLKHFIEENWWDEARVLTSLKKNETSPNTPIYAPTLPVTPTQRFPVGDTTVEIFYNSSRII